MCNTQSILLLNERSQINLVHWITVAYVEAARYTRPDGSLPSGGWLVLLVGPELDSESFFLTSRLLGKTLRDWAVVLAVVLAHQVQGKRYGYAEMSAVLPPPDALQWLNPPQRLAQFYLVSNPRR